MTKATRAKYYSLEFKLVAVRFVMGGQSMGATAKALGIAEQALHNWARAAGSVVRLDDSTSLWYAKPGFDNPLFVAAGP
ncbi:MAG: IS1 family transposase [Burkholderiales bacterium]|nr:IS1 family transposase [Burkholderiales bacterium]